MYKTAINNLVKNIHIVHRLDQILQVPEVKAKCALKDLSSKAFPPRHMLRSELFENEAH